MITEDYVSFECAKLLKEKGFDESTSMVYMSYGDLCKCNRYDSIRNSNYNDITKNYFEYTAPTLQMVMKWLREVHNIHIVMAVENNGNYIGYLYNTNGANIQGWDRRLSKTSYEDACEAAIKYCLENLI